MIDDYRDDDDLDGNRPPGILPESLRKALATGMSAVFMTEEGIRNAIGDMKLNKELPKEVIAYLVQSTERTRKDVFGAVSTELRGYLENIDVTRALRKALTGMKVEVKAEFKFVEDDESESSFSSTVTHEDDPPKTKSKSKARPKKKKASKKSSSKPKS